MGIANGTPAARPRRALRSRVSSGHVVMLLAGALGVLLTLSVLGSARATRPILVAARDLAPGTVLDASAVRVARVHADGAVLATMFDGTDATPVRGQVVTVPMRAGEVLTRSTVRPVDEQSATRVMSVSIARARAVDGKLDAGDRIDVLAVDHDRGRAGYVVTDAEVVGVDAHDGGALVGGSDDVTVSLVVDAQHAPALAAAIDAGTVMFVRATGAAPLRNTQPFETRSGP